MAKYQPGDTVTFYFIIKDMDNKKVIQAWTDSKELAKFYMDFHKCKHFRLKSITDSIEEINKIREENRNDEIKLCNIITRNRNKRRKDEDIITVCIPATETECMFIRSEESELMASRIDYSMINNAMPYFKNRYQNALKSIFLYDVILKSIYNQNPKFIQSLEIDNLMILYRAFPENFGE